MESVSTIFCEKKIEINFYSIAVSPLSVKLSGVDGPLSSGTTALIVCRATGSSPPAHVTLFKDSKPIMETTFSVSSSAPFHKIIEISS